MIALPLWTLCRKTYSRSLFDTNGLIINHVTYWYEGSEADEDIVWIGIRESRVQYLVFVLVYTIL